MRRMVKTEDVNDGAGVVKKYGYPMAEAVAAYVTAVGKSRVCCTNRHSTIPIYGYKDGRASIRRRLQSAKSCVYDGTQY